MTIDHTSALTNGTKEDLSLEELVKARVQEAEAACWKEIQQSLQQHNCKISVGVLLKDGKQQTLIAVEYKG
jgi:hypothetical protein